MSEDEKPGRSAALRGHLDGLMDRVIRVGTIVGLIALVPLYARQDDLYNCLTSYASDSARATAARSEAGARDRRIEAIEQDATDAVMLAAVTGRAELVKALADYQTARVLADTERQAAEALRERNPVPEAPSLTCGRG